MSPVHPCLVVICEYFRTPIKNKIFHMMVLTLIVFLAALACHRPLVGPWGILVHEDRDGMVSRFFVGITCLFGETCYLYA